MYIVIGIFIFALGAIIGSFLNVVALRYGTGRGIGGRSFCFSCGKTLGAKELFPILSFLSQRGKCSVCGSKISLQYPLVEAGTGLIFLLVFLKLSSDILSIPAITLPYYFILFSILIVIAVYDFKHKIIPDGLAFGFSVVALVGLLASVGLNDLVKAPHLYDLLAGPILFIPFFLLWSLSRGKWMGLGDAKLALGIGWMLGLIKGVSAIVLGFWAGALFSFIYMAYQSMESKRKGKNLTMQSEISFAPFLILGVILAFLLDADLFGLREILFSSL